MSYTVLARRYRSGTFDQVVGQAHVAQTLKKAISSGRIAHAYLFCGTRGVGKTSMARILAKALNCERSKGPTTEPCGECDSCRAIARGDDIDVIEIDAASNTGVDKIRDLIENSQYRPARSRLKIFIIDEVHMLSKSAFNALLKTLEEPPEHVKFILATTEPEKILPTILSRCQRYDFRNIPTREIADHLRDICRGEKIGADEDALMLVAKAGAGSMRDALSLLDRLLSAGPDQLTAEMVEQLLGLPKSQLLFDLANAIGDGDTRTVLTQCDQMISAGLSVEMLIASLVDHLRNLLVFNACGGATDLVEVPGLSLKQLGEQAGRFDTVVLSQDIVILEELRRMVRGSHAGRALLDATLVRLTLAGQFTSVSDLLDLLDGQPASVAQKKKSEPARTSVNADPSPTIAPASANHLPDAPPVADHSPTTEMPAAEVADLDVGDDLPAVGRVFEGESLGTRALLKPRSRPGHAQAASPSSQRPAVDLQSVDRDDSTAVWKALLALLSEQGPGLTALLAGAHYVGLVDGAATIQFAPSQQTFIKMLDRNGKRDKVHAAFEAIYCKPVPVRFEVSDALESAAPTSGADAAHPSGATSASPSSDHEEPAQASSAAPSAPVGPSTLPLTAELVAELNQDPLIHALLNDIGGNILRVTEI